MARLILRSLQMPEEKISGMVVIPSKRFQSGYNPPPTPMQNSGHQDAHKDQPGEGLGHQKHETTEGHGKEGQGRLSTSASKEMDAHQTPP
jgi:hypothetical protein